MQTLTSAQRFLFICLLQNLTLYYEYFKLIKCILFITVHLYHHIVKLRCCILCGDVAACRGMACVLFVVQTDTQCIVNQYCC
jgi:hypothetical protein